MFNSHVHQRSSIFRYCYVISEHESPFTYRSSLFERRHILLFLSYFFCINHGSYFACLPMQLLRGTMEDLQRTYPRCISCLQISEANYGSMHQVSNQNYSKDIDASASFNKQLISCFYIQISNIVLCRYAYHHVCLGFWHLISSIYVDCMLAYDLK